MQSIGSNSPVVSHRQQALTQDSLPVSVQGKLQGRDVRVQPHAQQISVRLGPTVSASQSWVGYGKSPETKLEERDVRSQPHAQHISGAPPTQARLGPTVSAQQSWVGFDMSSGADGQIQKLPTAEELDGKVGSRGNWNSLRSLVGTGSFEKIKHDLQRYHASSESKSVNNAQRELELLSDKIAKYLSEKHTTDRFEAIKDLAGMVNKERAALNKVVLDLKGTTLSPGETVSSKLGPARSQGLPTEYIDIVEGLDKFRTAEFNLKPDTKKALGSFQDLLRKTEEYRAGLRPTDAHAKEFQKLSEKINSDIRDLEKVMQQSNGNDGSLPGKYSLQMLMTHVHTGEHLNRLQNFLA